MVDVSLNMKKQDFGKIFEIRTIKSDFDKNNFYGIDYGLMEYRDKIIEEIYNDKTKEDLLEQFENINIDLTFKQAIDLISNN